MPPKKDSGPQLTEEEQEALELRMLEAEVAHQEVELKFLDEAIERLKVENDRLVMESNKLKIRLTAATSDAEHILHHKEADIDRMQTIIDLSQQRFKKLSEEKVHHEELIDKLRTQILESQKALEEADKMIEEKAQLDHKMRDLQVVVDRQTAKMEEKMRLIEEKKRLLEAAKVTTEALEVRAASKAETKILFGEQWLISCRRYRTVRSHPNQVLPADKPGNVTAVVGGKFFFTLGGRPEQQLKDMQMLNWQVDPPKWENPESGPTAPAIRSAIWRCGAVACPIKGSSQMLVFGGLGAPQPDSGEEEAPSTPGYTYLGVLHNDIWVFNLRSSKPWARQTAVKGDIPSKRMLHCAAVDKEGTQMFVFGGQDSASLLNDTWVFSRNTNQWSLISTDMGTPPSPRMGATFCSLDDGRRLLLFGGFDGTESLDDIHVLETDRKAWSKVKAVGTKSPKSRYCHVANIVSGRYMLVCGGTHVDAEGQRTALLDTWVLDLSTHSWELLHDSVVPAPLKPESVYAAFSSAEEQHAIIIVKPNSDEPQALDEVEVVELSLPEDIEKQKMQARKQSDIIASLQILPESEPVAFWAYDEGEIKRAQATGTMAKAYLAGAVMLRWSVPTKNNDHVVGYKIMMTTRTGITTEVGYGPAAEFAQSPRMGEFLVAGLRTGQQVTLTVKAIYDDGSFLWSNPCSFVVPVRATKAFKDGGLVDIEAAPDGLETDGDVWGAAM